LVKKYCFFSCIDRYKNDEHFQTLCGFTPSFIHTNSPFENCRNEVVCWFLIFCYYRFNQITSGISFKSQLLYTIVFLTRYIDLFFNFVSVYNTFMKIFFIGSSIATLYFMKMKFKNSWDPKLDTLRIEMLIIPSALLSVLVHYKGFDIFEV
jgi:hypothetical protein